MLGRYGRVEKKTGKREGGANQGSSGQSEKWEEVSNDQQKCERGMWHQNIEKKEE